MMDFSVKAYAKAGECHYKCRSFALAGKNAEIAGNIERDNKNLKESARYFELAAKYLVEGGKYERSCQLLVKTAKMIEEVDQKLSEELYEKVVDMCNTDGDMNDYASIAEDGLVKFNNFLFKADKYSKIIQNEYLLIKTYIARKQPHNIHKACFSIIALHLSKQEWVSAIDAHENFLNMMDMEVVNMEMQHHFF